ncbi:O-linked N-acetylglucosamine transferase family protein [Lelliottia amnigena]|uniref:O-linked N-acetylglucosamine transferase family protein n=1 Tax=Lelliottia amnigena TaxID=61646 RepID=UPI0020B2C8D6|nr:methyltransferase domain-containing protein [Lelliottia amnigena]
MTLYQSHCVTPDSIHAAATLNHIATTPPDIARILELGCGGATRLVMHASVHPKSTIIGIDIIESDIVKGQQLAAALKLDNIELFVAGLGDLLAVDPGEFDYIIIHQAFELTGAVERGMLLRWCQGHLAENGVVAIRWSILPDATPQSIFGEALRFHLMRSEEGADLVANIRAMQSFMLMTLEDGALKQEALAAEKMDDATLVQTYLMTDEVRGTLTEFSTQAEVVGLRYLGDIAPQTEIGEYYSPLIAQMLNVVSSGLGRVMTQQYLDYAVQRTERFSLLCHDTIDLSPDAPDLDCLRHLHWAGCFIRQYDDATSITNSFKNGRGKIINTDVGILIRIMELLGNTWPMSLSFEQLVFNCQTYEKIEDIESTVLEALKILFIKDEFGLRWSGAPSIYNLVSNNHLASAVLLPTLRPEQSFAVENLWGESVLLMPEEWDYLQGDMCAFNKTAWDYYSALKIKGLIIGSATAWTQHIQRFLRDGQIDILKDQLPLLLLLSMNQEQGGLLQKRHVESSIPDFDADALYAKLNSLINAGHFQQARYYAQDLMQSDSDNVHILRCYSRVCVLTSAWDEALLSLCKLMGYYFSDKNIYYDLAIVLHKKNEFYCARLILSTLLRLDNKNLDYWQNLASVHFVYGNMMLAEKCCRGMLRLNPQEASYFDMIGIIFSSINRVDEARYFMDKAVELGKDNLVFLSNLLFIMCHDATVAPEVLLEKHLEYGRRAQIWAEQCDFPSLRVNVKEPDRKLRLGFVSGDLRNHPVANFLLPFWDAVDPDKYELVAYSTIASNHDEISRHFEDSSFLWRQVDSISNVELAETIVNDRIDILFDLSGHTAHNRLPVFALRPAPVQITWIGYPGTTGLKEMDYIILPATLASTPGLEEQISEKAMFIATRKWFEPHPRAPEVSPLPALRNGYITFGSFNRLNKINDQVLKVWAKLLQSYPESKLLMGFMTEADLVASMTQRLLKLGITQDRLIYKGLARIEEYLAYHHEIDILLDSFPYTGGTTTHHGAWMGVPTLTLCGPTIACQQGVDIMTSYGLEQFIVYSEQEYIDKAVYWRDHMPELAAIRAGMRAQIPIKNEPGFNVAANFEKALREAWQLYCRGEQPRTLMITDQGTC